MPIPPEKYTKIYDVLCKSQDDSLHWNLSDFIENKERGSVLYFLNAHGVNMCARNCAFTETLLSGSYLLRDGVGIQIAFKWLGLKETENLNGTDLIPKIAQYYQDKKIAIYGSSDETLSILKNKLQAEGYNNIISMLHGFYDADTYVKDCKNHTPDLVILCMGMPKQELLSHDLKPYCDLVICGGGWADFYSGAKKRAPEWMRKANIEWCHRLIKEPMRLGKRYTIDIVYFFINIFKIMRASKKASDTS